MAIFLYSELFHKTNLRAYFAFSTRLITPDQCKECIHVHTVFKILEKKNLIKCFFFFSFCSNFQVFMMSYCLFFPESLSRITLWVSQIRTLLVLWESGLGSPRVYTSPWWLWTSQIVVGPLRGHLCIICLDFSSNMYTSEIKLLLFSQKIDASK